MYASVFVVSSMFRTDWMNVLMAVSSISGNARTSDFFNDKSHI